MWQGQSACEAGRAATELAILCFSNRMAGAVVATMVMVAAVVRPDCHRGLGEIQILVLTLRSDGANGCACMQGDQDSVSERLRRWTRNPLGFVRRGSNPHAVGSVGSVFDSVRSVSRLVRLLDGLVKTITSLLQDSICIKNNYFFTTGFHLY